MTSSIIGAERRAFLKADMESFPFPSLENVIARKRWIIKLAEALESNAQKPWDKIDDFIFRLYGLDDDDATVVRETLAVGSPYQSARTRRAVTGANEVGTFRDYLEEMLQPVFAIVGQQVNVGLVPVAKGAWQPSWRFLSIAIKGEEFSITDPLICSLMEEANKAAASRVIMRVPEGGLLLGILSQRRFWTRSLRTVVRRLPHATSSRCVSAGGGEMTTSGLFTQGVAFELPHPRIPVRLVLIVHAVIEHGLQLLREYPPNGFSLSLADEDKITFQLHLVIANRLYKSKEIPGFDKRTFGKPCREPKMTNFDGNHPDKMPDLVFFLNRDSLPVLLSHDAPQSPSASR